MRNKSLFRFSSLKANIHLVFLMCILFLVRAAGESTKIDETVFEGIINSIQIRNYESEMAHLKNSTDLTYLLYYYRKSSDNSKFGGYYLQRIDRKLDYLAMIVLVDCDLVIPRNVSHCQVKRTDTDPFPKIKLLVPPQYKFDPKTKKMNSHVELDYSEDIVSEEKLYKFISQNIPSFSTKLTKEHIEHFLGQPMFNKIILFTDKQNTPLTYRGLSNLYYDRILFGEVQSNNTEFVEKFNITKFPSIIAIQNPFLLKDMYSIHHYNGSSFAGEISEFIDQFALREKNYVRRMADQKIEKNPFRVITNENFDEFFTTDSRPKIVFFTNTTAEVAKIPEDIKRFAAVSSGYFHFAIFNCKNFKQLCKKEFYVDVDVLPSLYLFNTYSDYSEMMKKNRLLPTSFNRLLNYFVERIKSNVKKVTNDEIYDLVVLDRQNEKYPIVYVHKNETKVNLPLHLMSSLSEYSKKISFYELNDPADDILEIFKIKYKEPITILFMHDKMREDNFRLLRLEDAFKNNFVNIKTFIELIIGDYIYPIKKNDFKLKQEAATQVKFEPLEEATKFYRKCIFGNQYCVFALLNGDYDSEIKRTNLSYNKLLHTIESIPEDSPASKYINHFYYVNATCFDEFTATFKVKVSSLPTMVIYDPFSKMFARMKPDEPFDKTSVEQFLSDAIERKLFYTKLEESEIVFKDKYCQEKTTKTKDVDFERLNRIKQGLEDDEQEEEENKIKPDL